MHALYVYDNSLCVRALDFCAAGDSDSDAIEKAIAYAKETHINKILIDKKDWLLDRAILFYTGVTIIVDGVMLKQSDLVFDNIFRSEGFIVNESDPYGYPIDIKTVENFRIIGRNGASIEGPEVQPKFFRIDKEVMAEPLGDRWGWRGISVYFTCCKHFEFSGFKLTKTRSWAISLERATDVLLRDLEIYSECPNGDGINIRNGCSRIVIENAKGTTSDDFIAINNCSRYRKDYPVRTFKTYFHPIVASNFFMERGEDARDQDVHDIFISNVSSNSAIMFMARNGHRIYNVWVTNVDDGKELGARRNLAYMVGSYYGTQYGEKGEGISYSNIFIDGLMTYGSEASVLFRDNVKGLVVKNVRQMNSQGAALTAMDEDDITVIDCESVSGEIRRSVKDWVDPNGSQK